MNPAAISKDKPSHHLHVFHRTYGKLVCQVYLVFPIENNLFKMSLNL